MSRRIGVLSLQGDVAENLEACAAALGGMEGGGEAVPVALPGEIDSVGGLVIPGGESTAIGRAAERCGAADAIRRRAAGGMPVLGVCAGMVLMASEASGGAPGRPAQPLLGLLDAAVERNAFGGQRESFEADVGLGALGVPPARAAFIRAPAVSRAGPGVEELASVGGRAVAVRQGRLLAVSFHAELGAGPPVHRAFAETVPPA